jgi:hypothetical protein
MVNSEEINGSTEYLMQQTMAHKFHLNFNVLSKLADRRTLINGLRVQIALPDIMKLGYLSNDKILMAARSEHS